MRGVAYPDRSGLNGVLRGGLLILATAAAGSPVSAADCIESRGLVETVRTCTEGQASGAAELPRSVSVMMPRTAGRGSPATRNLRMPPPHVGVIADVARRYRIDPALLHAMVRTESAGKVGAVSNKGALGLMQVMPATARSMGIANPQALLGNPTLAIEAGAAYLKTLQATLGNNVPLVVAAYNAGPGAVRKAGMRVPAYRETQAYVTKVMSGYIAGRTALR